jgi:intracellular septation protein A
MVALWTYRNAFVVQGLEYQSVVSVGLHTLHAQLFCGGSILDEQKLLFAAGVRNIVHQFTGPDNTQVSVEVGYVNWRSVGIAVSCDNQLHYESHPGRDIRYAEKSRLFAGMPTQSPDAAREAKERWDHNKYSVFADVGLGIVFFLVGKLTGDLTLAALVGAAMGLGLVAVQRFVTVDLLGGFAIFGTVMLVVSAVFSLLFQSEMMVQMKGTVLGIGTALLFFGDGLLRRGAYFGERMQRYMPAPISTARMATGLGTIGLFMAALNYAIVRLFDEDAWLTYTTFIDTPISIALAYAVYFWARAGSPSHPGKYPVNSATHEAPREPG